MAILFIPEMSVLICKAAVAVVGGGGGNIKPTDVLALSTQWTISFIIKRSDYVIASRNIALVHTHRRFVIVN